MPELLIGPLMRYVDETSASIWVETDSACTVTVRARASWSASTFGAGDDWSAATFAVHGHHYALVEVGGLARGSRTEYAVELDGRQVWPEPGSPYPAPVIATLEPGKRLRLLFGSCRTSVSHDKAGNRSHGVDAMRAYALRMAGVTPPGPEPVRWPDLVLFLGDQVYADETTEAMQEFIESRRDIDEPPGTELKDFEEYAHLYRLAWTDPANRWLLSTLPSAMIFDDHDVRDDWNTSQAWRDEMEATSWWHGRIVAALASYWVYQHLGNLSPEGRTEDEIWQRVVCHSGPEELDLSDTLDAFADRADQHPETYRWSYSREIAGNRLVVVDSRSARVLGEDRALLDRGEMEWLAQQMRGDVEHLLIGTSIPFLLAPGLHHLEAFSEALAGGSFGSRIAGPGETLRQAVDLEHWAAFHESFLEVADLALAVASGERGTPPCTVTFLSGDVHHSYVARSTGSTPTGLRCPAASCRRSALRSATRCRRGCGSSPPRWRTASPGRSAGSRLGRRRCLIRRSAGRFSKARGSTTTSRPWRTPGRGC